MAKLKKGIFGPISGKLGPVVGGTWNGIPSLGKFCFILMTAWHQTFF
jgi:hypothetical protein